MMSCISLPSILSTIWGDPSATLLTLSILTENLFRNSAVPFVPIN